MTTYFEGPLIFFLVLYACTVTTQMIPFAQINVLKLKAVDSV